MADDLLPFEKEQEEIVFVKEKEDYQTNPTYGKKPEDRTTEELLDSSIVVIDKPPGPTSHQVSAYAKGILKVKKMGHSGTLDPGVTGVLPMGVNRATRALSALLPAGKEYVCVMHIHRPVEEYEVRKVFKDFIGKIKQLPPVKSAVKRRVREREVYYLDFLEMKGQDVLFKAGVQGGTYIRKLVHDIGLHLDTGAHMAELRRTKAGPFNESTNLVTLHDLADAYHYYKEGDDSELRKMLLPVETAVFHLAKIWVVDEIVKKLTQGVRLLPQNIVKYTSNLKKGQKVAVMTMKNELILIGEFTSTIDKMFSSRTSVVKTQQVLMKDDVYPKI